LDEEKGEAEDVGSSDGSGSSPNQSEEESENMEGEDAGEGENEDVCSGGCDRSSEWATSEGSASCKNPSNGDDDQSRIPWDAERYVDSIDRIREHLATSSVGSALSDVVALLDGFKDELVDPEGDSPCTMFASIAKALLERGDSEGAEMAMREGIETREEGDFFACHSSLAYLMAARGDIAGAERILLAGAAIEEEEGDGGEDCIENLDEIKERYGDPSKLDPSVLLVEGASDSPPATSTPQHIDGRFTTEEVAVGSGTGYDEARVLRDSESIDEAERAEADALLKWCEKPRVVESVWRPDEDSLLAAGVDTFPTSEAHRWRSIAEMVPGKNAAQCQSRARDEDFIKAHRYSGEKKKGTSASEPSLGSVIRDGDTDARLTELIIALPGGTTRRWRAIAREMGGGWSADDCLRRAASLARSASRASEKGGDAPDGARTAQPEPDLDEQRMRGLIGG